MAIWRHLDNDSTKIIQSQGHIVPQLGELRSRRTTGGPKSPVNAGRFQPTKSIIFKKEPGIL
ncbi:MAG: hypothetical protein C0456_10710 [Hyphomonas sp.]|nr:hypothetical protein [Hyphomonas sp.]